MSGPNKQMASMERNVSKCNRDKASPILSQSSWARIRWLSLCYIKRAVIFTKGPFTLLYWNMVKLLVVSPNLWLSIRNGAHSFSKTYMAHTDSGRLQIDFISVWHILLELSHTLWHAVTAVTQFKGALCEPAVVFWPLNKIVQERVWLVVKILSQF